MIDVIDLFCGTKSIANIAENTFKASVLTIDNNPLHSPDICADILSIDSLPKARILWASPPCQSFSVASMGHHWISSGVPRTQQAKDALLILDHLISLIDRSDIEYYFIENPVGMMRKIPIMAPFIRRTITYCQYGDSRMKPTDVWTNCLGWEPLPMCKRGAPCHESAPRGSKTGTQGLKNAIERGRIPDAFCLEVLRSAGLTQPLTNP